MVSRLGKGEARSSAMRFVRISAASSQGDSHNLLWRSSCVVKRESTLSGTQSDQPLN